MKLLRNIRGEEVDSGPRVAVLGCVHGNEVYSLGVFKRLKNINLLFGELDFYLVNEGAYRLGKRFVDLDLNRSFNSDLDNYETNLSKEVDCVLKDYDYIIDLHSTTSRTTPFLIYVDSGLFDLGVLDLFNIKKRVFIPNASFSLISQFKNAVSIEISICSGLGYAINLGEKYIISFLRNLGLVSEVSSSDFGLSYFENYECFGKVSKNNSFRDFKLTKSESGELFFPMLSGEVSYENLFCFKLRRKY